MINFDGEADEGQINPEEPLLSRNGGAPQSAAVSDLGVHSGPIECAEHSLLTEEDNPTVNNDSSGQQQVKLTNYHNLFFAGAPIKRPTDVAHIESQESIIPEA